MSNTKAEAILDYFELYRQKKREHHELGAELTRTRDLLDRQRHELQQRAVELQSMQKIITAMIDKDMDPVEVKLTNDIPSMIDSLWNSDLIVTDDGNFPLTASDINRNKGGITSVAWPSSIATYPPYNTVSTTKIYGGEYSLISTGVP